MKTKQFTDEEVMEWARRHDVAHSLPISDIRMMVDDAASMHMLRKEADRPPMAETPTPRTDAFAQSMIDAKVPESRCWPHWLKFARKQETDLQHLARVAGEALAVAIGELYHHSKEDAVKEFSHDTLTWAGRICHELGSQGINVEEVYSKALSEIQRIKNQTK